MIRAEIHHAETSPDGWTQRATWAITADIGHWNTEVLESLVTRVLAMSDADCNTDPADLEGDDQ